jgi:hypothetical protein
MAVLEVAKIQVRSGLYEDLPALDTGEFGWCVDTQQLFIGKGTLAEGAPETGVTEIITEYTVASIINSFNNTGIRWKPGQHNGEIVKVKMMVPIKFGTEAYKGSYKKKKKK